MLFVSSTPGGKRTISWRRRRLVLLLLFNWMLQGNNGMLYRTAQESHVNRKFPSHRRLTTISQAWGVCLMRPRPRWGSDYTALAQLGFPKYYASFPAKGLNKRKGEEADHCAAIQGKQWGYSRIQMHQAEAGSSTTAKERDDKKVHFTFRHFASIFLSIYLVRKAG